MKNLKKVYKFNINHSVIRQLSTPAYSGISLTPNSSFISYNSWSIESLKDYLNNSTWSIDDLNLFKNIDMTDLTNSLAAMNFTGSLLILFLLISILSAFYGNKLIGYFDLEKKYPKLAKVIQYRIKFQNYTILFNFIIITIIINAFYFIGFIFIDNGLINFFKVFLIFF